MRHLLPLLLLPLTAFAADPLPDGAELRLGRPITFSVQYDSVISPDGKKVAGFPPNQPLTVWEAETGKLLSVAKRGHSPSRLTWSKEGKLRGLFQGTDSFLLHEWADPADAGPDDKVIAGLSGPDDLTKTRGYAKQPVLSADGRRVLRVFGEGKGRSVSAFTPKPGTPRKWSEPDLSFPLPGHEFVGLSEDGNTLFAVQPHPDTNRRVLAYDLTAKKADEPAWTLDLPPHPDKVVPQPDGTKKVWNDKGRPDSVFSADGKRMVVRFPYGQIEVWDGPKGKLLHAWAVPTYPIPGRGESALLALSPDGKRLAISSREKTGLVGGVVYDLDTGKEAVKLAAGPNVPDGGLKYTPDGKRLYRAYQVWDAETGKELTPAAGHRGRVRSVVTSGDGKTVVTAGEDLTVRGWDAKTGEEKWRADFPVPVTLRQVGPDTAVVSEGWGSKLIEKPLVTLSSGKVAAVPGDMATGTKFSAWYGEGQEPLVAISPDGKTAVTADRQTPSLKVWDWPKGTLRATLKFDPPEKGRFDGVGTVAFTADGKELVGLFRYPDAEPKEGSGPAFRGVMAVERWDLAGEKRLDRTLYQYADTPTLTTNGKRVLVMNRGSVTDALTGELLLVPPEDDRRRGRAPALLGATLSPDGKTLAAADGWAGDGRIRWYELETGKELRSVEVGDRAGVVVAFLPDGRLVSAGEEVLTWKGVK